jgi:hypothetical protein
MHRVEAGSAMTAMAAGHGATISTFAPSTSISPSVSSSVLPVSVVSIIRLSVGLLLSSLALLGLVLTSPAGSR